MKRTRMIKRRGGQSRYRGGSLFGWLKKAGSSVNKFMRNYKVLSRGLTLASPLLGAYKPLGMAGAAVAGKLGYGLNRAGARGPRGNGLRRAGGRMRRRMIRRRR